MKKLLVRGLWFVIILAVSSCWMLGCSTQGYTPTVNAIESTLSITISPSALASLTSSPVSTSTPIPSQTPFPLNSLTGEIAFAGQGVDKSDGYIHRSIGIANANGQSFKYLITTQDNELFSSPTWSPDGRYLAYISVEIDLARKNIHVANVDSNQIEIIKTGNQSLSGLSWSPDGKQIAYSGDVDSQSDIFIINPTTRVIRQLVISSFIESFPSWSPDGEQIAYLRFDSPKYGDGAHLIVADVSQNQTQVGEVVAAPSRISWSPDGKQIVFRSNDGCGNIYMVEIDGSNLRQLTNLPGGERDPVWSPDGNFIAFSVSDFICDLSSGGEPVYAGWQPYVVSIQGGEPVKLSLASDSDIFNLAWLP